MGDGGGPEHPGPGDGGDRTVEWGKGCWVLQGSSTWNWNYHFRNKVHVLAPSCSAINNRYSGYVWEGDSGLTGEWGDPREVGVLGPAQVQGVRCFPALMASPLWKLS